MKFRDRTKLRFRILLLLGVASGMTGWIYTGLIQPSSSGHHPWVGIFTGVGVGVTIGGSELFFLRAWIKRKSFAVALLIRTAYYLTVIMGIGFTLWGFGEEGGFIGLSLGQLWGYHDAILFSLLKSFAFSLFFQINGLIGGRVLLSFFTGKYHQPVEENRIFMFLDLKSSTAIAEKIGHIQFHKFINDFLHTISEPIIANKGEIYKYVGDQVIITWKLKEGLRENQCLRLFFEASDRVDRERDSFEKKYGIVPEFKAGMHCGRVVSGEMGDTKREIAFLGDVINTTARIEKECSPKSRRLLISSDVFKKLHLGEEYRHEEMGNIQLRGKTTGIDLYAIERNSREEGVAGPHLGIGTPSRGKAGP
ncbi:MAG TPA: adenylate/guanylate cyclase domain-containing protein [Thermodesulfobacteriota bacterium]|nr:adenylate/guanylate cyclase domain-containing protein [Thermodesulfobacteriota bacterium]